MKYQQLSQEERYHIAFLSRRRRTVSEIAYELGRSPSTISRELRRNRTNHDSGYRAEVAHQYATARRRRVRRGSQFSTQQWELILYMVKMHFSPEQISNTLKRFKLFSISHETIYKYLLHDKRKGGTWYKYLRIYPKKRRKRYNSYDSRGRLAGKRHISERPAHIEKRNRIGHWEGDTVIGKDLRHCIVTLVERKSGFVIIKKIKARNMKEVNAACISAIKEHGKKIKTITFDNGTEFHGYEALEKLFPVKCYFATPYHSWERGSNENMNGLIRQYIPRNTPMNHIKQFDCDIIAYALNTRPRKRLGYKTPEEVYSGKDTLLHLVLEPRLPDRQIH
jgi:IS30 family transposase